MARSYRPVVRDQPFLLPPDMRDWLPADHLVWFLLETLGRLDTSVFHARHGNDGAGRAAYDPDMMLALLIYGYCRGIRSSRQIERLCLVDVGFRVACGNDVPDHSTIARFRADHQYAFAGMFTQVLAVAARAGLARFGTVAIDGTKIAANASLGANRGQDWLREEVARILAEAAAADTAEDVLHGEDDRGDGMPRDLRDPTKRAQRIAAAAAELAAEQKARRASADREGLAADRVKRLDSGNAKVQGRYPFGADRVAEAQIRLDQARAAQQARIDRRAEQVAAGRRFPGLTPVPVEENINVRRARAVLEAARKYAAAHPDETPASRKKAIKATPVTANITDPQSRVMPTRRGWIQGYNAQVAVTADQIIAALSLSTCPVDWQEFIPMMRAAQAAASELQALTGSPDHQIGIVLADAGYPSRANLTAPGPDRLIALGKSHAVQKNAKTSPAQGDPPPDAGPREAMSHRLRTPDGAKLYKRRGATVEPAIGNLKKILDRFSRRGLEAASSELHLAATAFNLLKIHRAALA
jgi:transposase